MFVTLRKDDLEGLFALHYDGQRRAAIKRPEEYAVIHHERRCRIHQDPRHQEQCQIEMDPPQ